jgi:hypothetical protein
MAPFGSIGFSLAQRQIQGIPMGGQVGASGGVYALVAAVLSQPGNGVMYQGTVWFLVLHSIYGLVFRP